MKAVVIRAHGDSDVLKLVDVDSPPVGPNQVRVDVGAFGVNRADILQRKGLYPAPAGAPAEIPGLEYAGVVESVGPEVRRWSVGDRVMGITAGGCYAEQVVVHAREAMAVPSNLSLEEAAVIPEAFLTAWDALCLQAGMKLGDRILVHAVGSGVGTAALQLASACGASVIGTSRSVWKLEACGELGLEVGLHVHEGRFLNALRDATEDAGVDLVLDLVGGAYLKENLKALAEGGTMITVGLVGGARGELNLGLMLARRLKLVGTVLRSRPLEEKLALALGFERQILPLFLQGRLVPVIGATFNVGEVGKAHVAVENNSVFGKAVVVWR